MCWKVFLDACKTNFGTHGIFAIFNRCMIYYSIHEILERRMLYRAATKLKSVLLRAPIFTSDCKIEMNIASILNRMKRLWERIQRLLLHLPRQLLDMYLYEIFGFPYLHIILFIRFFSEYCYNYRLNDMDNSFPLVFV